MDWNSFYIALCGSAATLMGLLFVAAQLNIDTLLDEPGNRWLALAGTTFSFYAVLFLTPLLFLIPTASSQARGVTTGIIVLVAAARSLRTWLPLWRGVFADRRERLWESGWLLVSPL